MSRSVRRKFAAVVFGGGALALVSAAGVHAEDDDMQDDPGLATRAPFVTSTTLPPEPDLMVPSAGNGDRDERVGALLAAHPDRDVLICLAGCGGGGPKLVTIRPRAAVVAAVTHEVAPGAELRPASAPQGPAETGAQPTIGDVICVAGCAGAPGAVVQHGIRLTWVGQGANEELRTALRTIARRLIAQDALSDDAAESATGTVGRMAWMPDEARRAILATPPSSDLPAVLAALVRSASAMAGRHQPAQP